MCPFPRSSKRNKHVFVLIDAFTKYAIIKAVPSTATEHVVKILADISANFGMPERIISDRGTCFTSKQFQRYCNDNVIKNTLIAVRTPRANGQVERMKRTILSMLLPSTDQTRKWDEELRTIQWTINYMKNSSTGRSPHELLFGYQPRDILGNKLILLLHDNEETQLSEDVRIDNLNETRQQAAEQI